MNEQQRAAAEAIVTKALARAYSLGQTYWQQADSESYSQNKRADDTQRRYIALIGETLDALLRELAAEPQDEPSLLAGNARIGELHDELAATALRSADHLRKAIKAEAEVALLRAVLRDVWMLAPGQPGCGDISRAQRTMQDVKRILGPNPQISGASASAGSES